MQKPKKIAILTNNDDDIYCFRLELINRFINDGNEVLVSCPNGPKFDLMRDYKYEYDNPNIDRRGTNFFADAKLLYHYYRLFKTSKPDIILTYTAKPNVYGGLAARLCKIPYICNVTGLGSVLKKGKLMQRFILYLFKISYRRASCIMFQNEANMKLAEERRMINGKYRLIPGSGVALSRFSPKTYPNGGDGKNGEKVVFNYIGRVLHDKGIDDYIEVAKRIKTTYPNTQFNIMGFIEPTEKHYESDLEKLSQTGIVNYIGSQKDVRPFIEKSHATIHPSTYGEGMSNVLLETAASSRPIITTDNTGCKETVLNGISGYIYHGGNVDELESCVEKFLSTPNSKRKEMGEQGRNFIEANFSRELVIDAYCKEIEDILAPNKREDKEQKQYETV